MKKTVIVIGGGLGGLFTGAFLSKEGYQVTVLEKNATIGGGLQCFKRNGTSFETGMHILGGFQPGGNLNRICAYLGILDKLQMQFTDAEAMDVITYGEDGRCYKLPSGKEAFTNYLKEQFPTETEGIQQYMDALYSLCQKIDLFNLRSGKGHFFAHDDDDEAFMPADKFIAKYVTNSRLRDLLAYMSPMYGGIAGHTPTYIHAMINVLYINGSSQFIGGSQQLADCLADIIRENGGQVIAGDAVAHIEVHNRFANRVITQSKKEYSADWYISDVHPDTLFSLTGNGAFPKSYVDRVRSIPNSYSAFSVYLKFKSETQPYVNHPCYYQERYETVWQLGDYDEDNFPQGFMYITPPSHDQGPWAERMIVNCLMPFEPVRKWEHTTVGHRGADYQAWKECLMNKVINKLDALHPGFRDSIEMAFASSPLTIRDYYGVKDGSLYGHQWDCENMVRSQMPIVTKVRNLLLTGQNVNLHGICGVPLTAIETAETIVGRGMIVEKISKIK